VRPPKCGDPRSANSGGRQGDHAIGKTSGSGSELIRLRLPVPAPDGGARSHGSDFFGVCDAITLFRRTGRGIR
jgi:hypothetical protein